MKIEIKEEKKNPLMKREEVMFSVEHGGKATPARKDLLKEVAGKLKVKEDLIIIDKIFSTRGRSESDVTVLVYKKRDDIPKGKLEKMERRMEKKKKKAVEETKPAEAKPEQKEEADGAKTEGKDEVKEAKEEPKKEEKKPEEAKEEEKASEEKAEDEKKG